MEKEYLIKKWLDNNLTPLEKEAFESLDDYETLTKISKYTKEFRAPEYTYEEALNEFESRIESKNKVKNWYKPLLKIAAILAIFFGVYYYNSTLNTDVYADVAEMKTITLPDNSVVNLNALSQISFNKKKWKKQRAVTLNGEAFFKVAKGSAFDVLTSLGKITVLGTQFNVKQRNDYFEVICYEGLVQVNYKNVKEKISPGQSFVVLNNTRKIVTNANNIDSQPDWLTGTSGFKSVPLKNVLLEFERQYKIKIISTNINLQQLFTGKFTHNNIDLAIKSILQPLNIVYTKTNNTIILKNE